MKIEQKLPSYDEYTKVIISAGVEVTTCVAASHEYAFDAMRRYFDDPTVEPDETYKTWAEEHYGLLASSSWLGVEVEAIFAQFPWVRPLVLDVEIEPVSQIAA